MANKTHPALDLATRGWRIVPIHNPSKRQGLCSCGNTSCSAPAKHPRIEGWFDDASTDAATIQAWFDQWPQANIGIAFGAMTGLIDIEVDDRNGGTESIEEAQRRLGALPETVSFRSGRGGLHRLYKYPKERVRKQNDALKKYLGKKRTGIDVLSDGGQALVPPSKHINGNLYEWVNHPDDMEPAELPQEWVDVLCERDPGSRPSEEAEDEDGYNADALLALSATSPLPDITLAVAEQVLSYLSADCDYTEWVAVGQALRHQFPEQQEEAKALFDKWSQTAAERYPGAKVLDQQWASYGKREDRMPITFRSVLKLAKDQGYKPAGPERSGPELEREERQRLREEDAALLAKYLNRLRRANTDADLADIAADLRRTELFDGTRQALIDAYQAAYTRIHPGKKLSKKTSTELLSDAGEREERARQQADEEGWFKPYVYCEEDKNGSLYHVDHGGAVSVKVFDDVFSSRLVTPISRAQGKVHPIFLPSALVLNCDLVPKVRGVRYAPGRPLFYDDDGVPFVNSYRSPAPPAEPMLFDERETAAVQLMERHIHWLLGPQRAKLMIQFLAHIVQHPEERIRWCYLVIGPKGNGKTFLTYMMRHVLGNANVRDVGPATLGHTTFNGWAEGAQLLSIEELKVDGVNKWEVMNALKAVISNDWLNIHRKGRDDYQAQNTASLIGFSNHENAVAVTPDDRRWYIVNTRFLSRSAFLADLGGPEKARQYFRDLHATAKEYADAIRGWLASVDLSDFDASQAADSSEKRDLAQLAVGDTEDTLGTLIKESASPLIRPHILSLRALRDTLSMGEGTQQITGQAIARLLREMGWRIVPGDRFAAGKEPEKTRWYYRPDHLGGLQPPPNDAKDIVGWVEKALAL